MRIKFLKSFFTASLLITLWAGGPLLGQSSLDRATDALVYKTIDTIELKLWIYEPPDQDTINDRSAIVFFFGGGWNGGNPVQFAPHCEYLAARGMVAITAEYRVFSRHGVKANICVQDAKSAMRWIREKAFDLRIDPNRIVAAGGSAGGHLAACTALVPEHNSATDDLNFSSVPNALALFNPVVILAPFDDKPFSSELISRVRDRMGAELETLSPFHHIKRGSPPAIVFHGTADKTVKFRSVELFQKKMIDLGNKCTLVAYEGEEHAFFNYGRKSNAPFVDTMQRLDQFLVELGFLESGPPSAEVR